MEFPALDYTELLTKHAGRRLRTLLPASEELYGRVHTQVAVGWQSTRSCGTPKN